MVVDGGGVEGRDLAQESERGVAAAMNRYAGPDGQGAAAGLGYVADVGLTQLDAACAYQRLGALKGQGAVLVDIDVAPLQHHTAAAEPEGRKVREVERALSVTPPGIVRFAWALMVITPSLTRLCT